MLFLLRIAQVTPFLFHHIVQMMPVSSHKAQCPENYISSNIQERIMWKVFRSFYLLVSIHSRLCQQGFHTMRYTEVDFAFDKNTTVDVLWILQTEIGRDSVLVQFYINNTLVETWNYLELHWCGTGADWHLTKSVSDTGKRYTGIANKLLANHSCITISPEHSLILNHC